MAAPLPAVYGVARVFGRARESDHRRLPESPRERVGARRVGRAGFLGVVGAGVATLFYGKVISHATGRVTNPLSDATGLTRLIPSSGWRIYTVADSMPTFEPGRAGGCNVERPRAQAARAVLRRPAGAAEVAAGLDFHCVTGWVVKDVTWGGVRLHELLDRRPPNPPRHAVHFVSAEKPYDDYLDLDQVDAPRRDARLRDGRQAAPRESTAPRSAS